MPLYRGFSPESSKLIIDALGWVLGTINQDLKRQQKTLNPLHASLIQNEYQKEMQRVSRTIRFLAEEASNFEVYSIPENANDELMNVIRSGLEIYLKDTIKARNETGLTAAFDSKIQVIEETINLENVKKAKSDLFDKFFRLPTLEKAGKKIELFISYSTKDKVIAGKLADLLTKRGIEVFLAHEDIEVSDEWRSEILKHLNNDTYLISLLTDSYAESTWGNQEAGYMMGKGGKTISIVIDDVDIKKFGFIESLQGISVNHDNIDACIDEIIQLVAGS